MKYEFNQIENKKYNKKVIYLGIEILRTFMSFGVVFLHFMEKKNLTNYWIKQKIYYLSKVIWFYNVEN